MASNYHMRWFYAVRQKCTCHGPTRSASWTQRLIKPSTFTVKLITNSSFPSSPGWPRDETEISISSIIARFALSPKTRDWDFQVQSTSKKQAYQRGLNKSTFEYVQVAINNFQASRFTFEYRALIEACGEAWARDCDKYFFYYVALCCTRVIQLFRFESHSSLVGSAIAMEITSICDTTQDHER